MGQKVLILYATKTGSTIEVARAIAEELLNRGCAVEIAPAGAAPGLAAFDAVIIGSAVRFGRWLPEALQFVEQNQAALQKIPVGFFAVHLMNRGDDDSSRKARLAYLEPARKLVTPLAEAYFSGVGDMSKVNFIERLITRMVRSPEGDFRDWSAIQNWAQNIPL